MLTKRARLTKQARRLSQRLTSRAGRARGAFLFGMQRSGTNMLLEALARNRRVECFNEGDDEAFDRYRLRDDVTVRRLISRSCADLVVFKPICDSQHAGQLLDAHPQSKAVWIYRYHGDVVNSALRNFNEHSRYLYYMLHDPETAGWRVENVSRENMALVQHWYSMGITDPSARALIWYLRNVQFFEQSLDCDDRVRLAGYEQVVTAPETELAGVCTHLAIEFSSGMAHGLFRTSVRKSEPPHIDPRIVGLCHELHTRLETVRIGRTGTAEPV